MYSWMISLFGLAQLKNMEPIFKKYYKRHNSTVYLKRQISSLWKYVF